MSAWSDRPAVRPYPSFAPYIVWRWHAQCCAECKAEGPHQLALHHLQHVPALGVHVRSLYPLCRSCAKAAQARGWPALAAILAHAAMPAVGGMQ
jgi:hypothetical protein